MCKTRQDPVTDESMNFRSRAEAAMQEKVIDAPDVSTLPTKELQALVHELRVHQIELEMQNDELKRVQLALESTRDEFQDLYDFSHVGYFTLTHKGLIKEVNRTGALLLGMPFPELIKRGFGYFVTPESLDDWDHHIINVLGHEKKQTCDLMLKRENGSTFYACLESIRLRVSTEQQQKNNGGLMIRIAVIDITDRKRMEDALRQTEELFSKVFSENPDAITISSVDDGIFVSVNEGFKRSLGYTEEEVIGKTSLDLDIWDNPEDRNRAWAALNSEGKIENFEAPFRTKSGDIRYGLMSASVLELNVKAHILTVTRDITELRQAQEAHKLLFKAIEHASEGVIITDPTGIIQYVNPAQEILSGYSGDELLGQTANILTSDKHDEIFFSGLWETIKSGNVWTGRFINRKKDGTEYHEDATISPVYDHSGNLTHFVAVKHDVTSQIEIQEQLLHARQMESIGMLADRFVHEFNDKLQIINGYVSLTLSRQGLPEIVRSNMRAIKQTANSGADLIKKIAVYGRNKSVKFQPLNLNDLIEQARSVLVQSLPRMMDLKLVLNPILWTIKGSHSQILQILMNLVKNAMDAMPHGGGIIIKTRNITLDENYCRYHPSTKPGRYALMELSDTGKGMDSELIKHIFEPLFTTKEQDEGAGLGLALVRGLVEQHGGRIVCLSDPSVGATFRLYFPAMEEVPEEQYSEKKELPKGKTETILLVDDEPNVLETFSRLLRESNFRVIPALNGKDALELYEKHREEIGLVCLDLLMPVMNGKECLRALLKIDPKVRVLVVSGALKEGMAEELKEAGASGVILKPFDMGRMIEKIRKLIDGELT